MPEKTLELIHVDDDPNIIWLVKELAAGRNIVQHEDSRMVLEEITRKVGAYDALLTDNTMLEMSGIELATQVRKVDSGLHIVLITGGHIDGIEVGSGKLFDQILQKPLRRADFSNMLSKIQPRQKG